MAIRVGFVIGQLTIGGAEGQLLELLRHLDRHFLPTVYCLTATAGPVVADLEQQGIRVRIIGQRGLRRAVRLGLLLRADQIDLVHSWLFIANGYAAAATLLGRTKPLITSARNCKVQGRFSRWVNTRAFGSSQAIVVNSRDVEDYIVTHYDAPRPLIEVIHNGVDIERFHPASEWDAPPAPVVTNIGRLVRQKDQELFLEAAAALHRELPAVRFLIIGDGPLRERLEQRASELGIAEQVTFAGERRDIDALLRQSSLFWLTSRWEGMPNVVLEALASGVPVVATDVGGTRALIEDGVDGHIVASGDAAAFVRCSLPLLQDEVLYERFALAARRRAEGFSPQHMAQNFEALYDRLLEPSLAS